MWISLAPGLYIIVVGNSFVVERCPIILGVELVPQVGGTVTRLVNQDILCGYKAQVFSRHSNVEQQLLIIGVSCGVKETSHCCYVTMSTG